MRSFFKSKVNKWKYFFEEFKIVEVNSAFFILILPSRSQTSWVFAKDFEVAVGADSIGEVVAAIEEVLVAIVVVVAAMDREVDPMGSLAKDAGLADRSSFLSMGVAVDHSMCLVVASAMDSVGVFAVAVAGVGCFHCKDSSLRKACKATRCREHRCMGIHRLVVVVGVE